MVDQGPIKTLYVGVSFILTVTCTYSMYTAERQIAHKKVHVKGPIAFFSGTLAVDKVVVGSLGWGRSLCSE